MKKINIPIHSHTKVRRKRSVWVIDGLYDFCGYSCNGQNTPLITDLQRVPKGSIADIYNQSVDFALRYPGTCFGGGKEDNMTAFLADEFRKAGFEPYPTKKLGFWRNLWQNKIRKR